MAKQSAQPRHADDEGAHVAEFVGANMGDDGIVDGVWEVNASFAPALLAKGVESTRREIAKWWKDGVSEQEAR